MTDQVGPTTEEIETIVSSGKNLITGHLYDQAYDLLFPLHESQQLSGTDQGDLAYHVGEACFGLGSNDAAVWYYEQARDSASSEIASFASIRLTEVQNLDAATTASHDGVTGSTEVQAVLIAAEEGFWRSDFDLAMEKYSEAFQASTVTPAEYGRAAIGIAECYFQQGEIDQAESYAGVAKGIDDSRVGELFQDLQERIDLARRGDAALEGGADGTELALLIESGRSAGRNADFDTAYEHMSAVYESSYAPTSLRGRAAYYLALLHNWWNQPDETRRLAEEARSSADPEFVGRAESLLQQLDQMDDALAIAERHGWTD